MRFLYLGPEDPMEKGMAAHSWVAWRIPRTEEPGGLQSMGSQRVEQDRVCTYYSRTWDILANMTTTQTHKVLQPPSHPPTPTAAGGTEWVFALCLALFGFIAKI